MLNIREELDKLKTIPLQGQAIEITNPTKTTLAEIKDDLNKLTKAQRINANKLDEMIEYAEDKIDYEEEIRQLKRAKKETEDNLSLIVSMLLESLDTFETVYRYAKKSNNLEWKEQLTSLWDALSEKMLSHKLVRIDGEGQKASPILHDVVNVVESDNETSGIIVDAYI